MRALMRSLAPSSFEDVAALIALYRPGPMAANMHNDYADRKNGRKPVEYFHPDAEELLADTYGRSEEHTSELQSLMRISYAVFCLKKKTHNMTKLNNELNNNTQT